MQALVGVARGASLIATLQLVNRVAADVDGIAVFICILDVDATGWFPSGDGTDNAGIQPALPVLDPHRTGEAHGSAGVGTEYAVAPSRASCVKRKLSRQEPWWDADRLGSPVWDFRQRRRAGGVRAH